MCGIIGYFGHFSSKALHEGLKDISHRGPDDSGEYINTEEGVGLAHARLSILEPSVLGHQPMASADGQVVIIYNGEIYNFQELRVTLEAKGFSFRSHSDTEVLLNLYLHYGEAMLPKLSGIFAFAIWDNRSRELMVARDALGVKPIYYTSSNCGVAFSSELKGVLPFLTSGRNLDHIALHRYLSFLWCPGERTPLKEVQMMAPGEAMILREGKVQRRWNWYRLPVSSEMVQIVTKAQAKSEITSCLSQSVHRQMVSDVPLGAFLSGGLDSSAVVAFAREKNPNIRCFTIELHGGQDEGFVDDLPYAKKVAEHLNVPLDIVHVDAERMAHDVEWMVAQLDEPLADPAALNVYYICKLAREMGIKVLLSGAGGDDLFSGYRRHHALQLERYWRWLPSPARGGLRRFGNALDQRRAFNRRLGKLFGNAELNENERLAGYFRWSKEADLYAIYTPSFRDALDDNLAASPIVEFLETLPNGLPPLERMLLLEQRFFLADHNLIYTDKMSMAAGIEVRVPLIDLDLVALASKIPVGFKQKGRIGKWILKKAMEPYLPQDVIYRPKSGFGAPLRRWLKKELRCLLGDLLSADSLKRRGLFNPVAVQKMIIANDKGMVDASYTLFSLMCIEIWCRKYID